ncbi:MAG: hypothetical protein P9L95_08095, partial [Candidatus Tenebribacter mawsonii]|nr:hypothetical protein [Candidatus Tenebribacter mawsonii]
KILNINPNQISGDTILSMLIPAPLIATDSLYFERLFIRKRPESSTITGDESRTRYGIRSRKYNIISCISPPLLNKRGNLSEISTTIKRTEKENKMIKNIFIYSHKIYLSNNLI